MSASSPSTLYVMHTRKHRIDHLESLIDLFSHFGAGQDNLAAYEDEEYDFRLDHAIDEAREQLRLI